MPIWAKGCLGLAGGAVGGGVLSFILLKPIIAYLENARPRDEIREFNVLIAIVSVPLISIGSGAIIGLIFFVWKR